MKDSFVKKHYFISILISLSYVIVINNFYRFFQNNASYEFDPWLSNYQGGFVRRGIPGEFFFQINDFLNIHPGWMVFIFVSLLYFFFYLIFFNLIKKIELNKLLIFSLFSPLAFYFPILNSRATGHKEIIFLFLLSLFCYFIPNLKRRHANYLMIFIIIFTGLSYEVLTLYTVYLVIPFVYIFNFNNFKDLLFSLIPAIIIASILILLNLNFKGTEQHVMDICNSLNSYLNPECQNVGKIADLKMSLEDYTIQKSSWAYGSYSIYPEYFKIYITGFIVGFLPLIILYGKYKLTESKILLLRMHPILILFLPILFTFPIYYMGADWGRYLYISYMSSLIIGIFFLKNNIFFIKRKVHTDKNSIFIKSLFVSLVTVYCFGWTVPICCEKNFKPGISEVVKRIIYYYDRYN